MKAHTNQQQNDFMKQIELSNIWLMGIIPAMILGMVMVNLRMTTRRTEKHEKIVFDRFETNVQNTVPIEQKYTVKVWRKNVPQW